MIAFLLIATLLQTPAPEPTVTLILRGEERPMKASEAQAQYDSLLASPEQDHALFAALTLALGTIPDHRVHEPQLTPQERERFRWHRRPLQGQR